MNISVHEVFVTSGMPQYTYVGRDVRRLEERLRDVVKSRQLAVLSGRTKSGKSVLAQKIYPTNSAVWISGSEVADADYGDFWRRVQNDPLVAAPTEFRRTEGETAGDSETANYGGGVNAGLIKAGVGGEKTESSERSIQTERVHRIPPEIIVPRLLDEKRIPLNIDDFHLIKKETQKRLVGAFKGMVDRGMIVHGVAVVLLTVPQHRGVVVRHLSQMAGRTGNVDVPPWEKNELLEIARLGSAHLNLDFPPEMIDKFADESQHCPNLMQQLCRKICLDNDIQERSPARSVVCAPADMRKFFVDAARQGVGKELYARLSEGVKLRQRKLRRFKQGGEGDLYEAIARALACLQKRKKESDFSFRELIDDRDSP